MFRYLPWRIRILLAAYYLKKNGIACSKMPHIEGYLPHIDNKGTIAIADDCYFRSFRLRQSLVAWPGAVMEIGRGAFINDGVNICASKEIRIGHSAKIGDMTYIYDTDFHETAPGKGVRQKPVLIGNNVWIGARVTILAGTSIGDHSVIAAGSVVTGAIPVRSLAAGSPARVVKALEMPDDWVRH